MYGLPFTDAGIFLVALYDVEKTMIFVQHKREADRVAIHLALQGFKVISTHGSVFIC